MNINGSLSLSTDRLWGFMGSTCDQVPGRSRGLREWWAPGLMVVLGLQCWGRKGSPAFPSQFLPCKLLDLWLWLLAFGRGWGSALCLGDWVVLGVPLCMDPNVSCVVKQFFYGFSVCVPMCIYFSQRALCWVSSPTCKHLFLSVWESAYLIDCKQPWIILCVPRTWYEAGRVLIETTRLWNSKPNCLDYIKITFFFYTKKSYQQNNSLWNGRKHLQILFLIWG